jgi:hypothetical protein
VLTIPDVDQRLPLRPIDRVIDAPLPELTPEQQAGRDAAAQRMKTFTEQRDRMRAERSAQIDEWEANNAAIARDVRARYDAEGK